MKVLRGLTIDNGGSEVRMKEANSDKIATFTNSFRRVNPKGFRVRELEDPYELCEITKAPNKEMLGVYAHNEAVESYEGIDIPITSQERKTDNPNYFIQLICDIAKDAALHDVNVLSKEYCDTHRASKVLPTIGRAYTYVLVILIPLREHSGALDGASILRKNIEGDYEVKFPAVKDMVVKFTIDGTYTKVLPEGGVAITALRKELGKDSISMVADLGHGTFDLALFQGSNMLGKVISSPYAGSVLLANTRQALAEAGYVLNEKATQRAIATGFAKRGANEYDVSGIIVEQKEMFVDNYLKKEVFQLLNMNGINASQIENLIPIGACMNTSKDGKTGSVINMLTKACKMEDVSVKIVKSSVLEEETDLRYVNINQASLFCDMLYNSVVVKNQE